MIKPLQFIPLLFVILLASFKIADKEAIEFSYPKNDKATISMQGEGFKKFKKEWRGQDYYYMGDSKNDIICSVLYFKLNDEEQAATIKQFGNKTSAEIPLIYFTGGNKAKEKNMERWGKPEDDFNFSQKDIELGGPTLKQKNMFAYAMFGQDLFVKVHLSKLPCSAADSTEMRAMLQSLVKKVK